MGFSSGKQPDPAYEGEAESGASRAAFEPGGGILMEPMSQIKNSVFITGATGFLGSQVTRLILEQRQNPVIVLVRGKDATDARLRIERAWQDWPGMIEELGKRIRIVNGDLCLPGLGLHGMIGEELAGGVSHIIHIAADIRLNAPLEELHRINVEGVRNILEFARSAHRGGGLERFSYVSTAYVAGGRKGCVAEEDLTDRYGFSNRYEQSKFAGESLVREAGKALPVSIYRPGMVVGDSKKGAVKTFNTLYFPLRLYLTGKLKFFPVDPDMKVNLVPCDLVSEAIAGLTFDPRAEGMTFHLTLPYEALPTVREMIRFTGQWAAENLFVGLPSPVFLPVSIGSFQWAGRFFREKSPIRSLLSLASYFEEDRIYKRDNLDRLAGRYPGSWREFFPQLLAYAADHGFMHRSERTVHEQAYFRLSGKTRPVGFHDIVSGKVIDRKPEDVRIEIEAAASLMKKMGILPGDRVAIVGYNNSSYFAIDAAIGLCGAVSVPLYYSSPASELAEIIKDSGSCLLFVGVPAIRRKLAGADLKIPILPFCAETPEAGLPETDIKAPVGFGDVATLRYTSGTTGRPKGAVFDHANLRSMAETLASLPPWKARTQRIVYLSFLPMNHVVEGILASYAIFYSPAPVDIYYLEDFQELQKVLPKVRPTVFFSVPRFYEKVWEQTAKSAVGRLYLKSRGGLTRRLLRVVLHRAVTKKAGIDRCKQLIVGSAPVSSELLRNFHEIGIEIHNAYGLTEAPLITLNCFMKNRIGTVGEPLPETEIRIAEDGEILVKGPQVMRGYYTGTDTAINQDGNALPMEDGKASPLENGWLHTGDLGALSDDGYLTLQGRKKEGIISSYGKNIDPVKIELILREAAGVDHVMVIGDNKPYCTALLFGSLVDSPETHAAVEAGIGIANERLSHPEQIKKWVYLAETLSIEGGDLTANLKMKRSAVAQKYGDVIESLYGNRSD
jgi:long-chain acyl-CoA synthetase